jgi:hypothetical protein
MGRSVPSCRFPIQKIDHVSRTSVMVACYRAIAAGDPNPETRNPDYLAETLWDPELMALVPACADLQRPFDEVRADYVHRQAIVPFFVVARTKFIDQSLQASLAEGVRLAGCPRNDDRHLGRPTAPRFTGQRSLGRHDDRPRRDSNFFTLGVSMSLTAPTRSSQVHREDRRRCPRDTGRSDTIFANGFSCRRQTIESKRRSRKGPELAGVCDNLLQAARNSLILKTERWPSG